MVYGSDGPRPLEATDTRRHSVLRQDGGRRAPRGNDGRRAHGSRRPRVIVGQPRRPAAATEVRQTLARQPSFARNSGSVRCSGCILSGWCGRRSGCGGQSGARGPLARPHERDSQLGEEGTSEHSGRHGAGLGWRARSVARRPRNRLDRAGRNRRKQRLIGRARMVQCGGSRPFGCGVFDQPGGDLADRHSSPNRVEKVVAAY